MNLTKALKAKKKLIAQIATAQQRVFQNNSYNEGVVPDYNAANEFDIWSDLTQQLVDLKTKIHLANAPIYSLLFRLSESKAFVQKLKGLNTQNGLIPARYNQPETKMIAVINNLEKDKLIAQYEEQIENLQDEIETFNAKTKI